LFFDAGDSALESAGIPRSEEDKISSLSPGIRLTLRPRVLARGVLARGVLTRGVLTRCVRIFFKRPMAGLDEFW